MPLLKDYQNYTIRKNPRKHANRKPIEEETGGFVYTK